MERSDAGLDLSTEARGAAWPAATGWLRPALVLGIPLLALAYDLRGGSHAVLDGSPPELSAFAFVRSALLAATAALLAVLCAGEDPGAEREPALPAALPGGRLAGGGIFALALAFPLVLLADPLAFNRLASEEGWVEAASALAALAAAGVFAAVFLRLRPGAGGGPLARPLAAACAGVLFLLGMEEISWGQRYLGFGSPEAFDANLQGEVNLHNFATGEVEAVYYAGAFLLLVLLPFALPLARRAVPAGAVREALERFTPSSGVAVLGALFTAYTYDLWNTLSAQLGFFFALAALGILAARARGAERAFALAGLVASVSVQAAFLALGGAQVRMWDVTEYKELLIPLCFLVYALEVLRRGPAAGARA